MNKKFWTMVFSSITVVLLVLLDQWTKWLTVVHLKNSEPIVLIPGVFELTYTENRGAAFGMMQNQRWFFFIATAIVLIGVVFLLLRMPYERRYLPFRSALVVFMAGAIGNLIDRVSLGYVVDFLYFKLINFPVFNVADCYVTITVFVFVILFLFVYKEEELAFIPGMVSKKDNEA